MRKTCRYKSLEADIYYLCVAMLHMYGIRFLPTLFQEFISLDISEKSQSRTECVVPDTGGTFPWKPTATVSSRKKSTTTYVPDS